MNHPKRSKLLKRLQSEKDTSAVQENQLLKVWSAVNKLHYGDESAQLRAAWELIKIGEYAVPALIEALSDDQQSVWRLASAALVKIGEPAVNPLIELLGSENEQVRLLAAGALHKMEREPSRATARSG